MVAIEISSSLDQLWQTAAMNVVGVLRVYVVIELQPA
jgi:hypothetical protein